MTQSPYEIIRFTTREGFEAAYPIMQELRAHLSREKFLELLYQMAEEGYELWGLLDEGEIRALAGIAFRTNFYYGRYVWVFDLITTSSVRSSGYGAALLEHIEDLGRKNACDLVALSSGVQRHDAHRFYEKRMGYDKVSFTFTKKLRS